MATSEERREVAARDKFVKAVRGDIPFSPIYYSMRVRGLANILADMIDPVGDER